MWGVAIAYAGEISSQAKKKGLSFSPFHEIKLFYFLPPHSLHSFSLFHFLATHSSPFKPEKPGTLLQKQLQRPDTTLHRLCLISHNRTEQSHGEPRTRTARLGIDQRDWHTGHTSTKVALRDASRSTNAYRTRTPLPRVCANAADQPIYPRHHQYPLDMAQEVHHPLWPNHPPATGALTNTYTTARLNQELASTEHFDGQ